jgi:hypothetical protein
LLEGNAETDRGQRLERVLPPLSGDGFKGNWNRRPLSDLFDKIRETMPRDEQGRLTARDTAESSRICSSSMNFPPPERIFRPTPARSRRSSSKPSSRNSLVLCALLRCP